MTLDERAKELARAIVFGNGLVSSAIEVAKQAITAAVEEEREACAKIAQQYINYKPGGLTARTIEQVIRERNKTDGGTK